MKKVILIASLIASATTLGGCGTYNGFSHDPMQMVFVHRNPDYGKLEQSQYAEVVRHANSCMADANNQLSSPAESIIVGGLVGAVTGAVGVGEGMKVGFGSKLSGGGPYGAIAGGAGGLAGGAQGYSGARAADIGSCTGADLSDAETKHKVQGVHAFASYVRTKNKSNRAPSWVVPDSGSPRSSVAPSNQGSQPNQGQDDDDTPPQQAQPPR